MKTVWRYSTKTEAERLLHCAHQIVVGFYRTNNFIVLPYRPYVENSQIVTFPLLTYNKIHRFWEESKRLDVRNLPLNIDEKLVEKIEKLIMESNLPKPNFSKTQNTWNKVQDKIIEEVYKILPSKKNLIKKILIYPTVFGTGASFNFVNKNGEVIIYLREDRGISTITEAIITSITRDDIYTKLEGVWQESEIITDFLITQTSISRVLKRYEDPKLFIPTLKGTRVKEQAKLTQESAEFCKQLGIPNFDKPFSLNGLTPELFGKPLVNLSDQEKKVLLNLIKNSNTVTPIDELGDTVFKSEDEFSLYAITKTIQRLRNKLETNGISGSYIQTLRGKGYLLKN